MREDTMQEEQSKFETRVKICGLTSLRDIEYVNEYMPDYIGFVFVKQSTRYITPERAAKLRKQLSPSIQAVGVFVQEEPEVIAKLFEQQVIDIAQLHGKEDEEYIQRLRKLIPRPIIQAISIAGKDDLQKVKESTADYLLLDSPNAGSGRTFDWSLLSEVTRPYFLAGGLNLFNIDEALRVFSPYGVDVSSGVETDGRKDQNKIAKFIETVRNRKDNKL